VIINTVEDHTKMLKNLFKELKLSAPWVSSIDVFISDIEDKKEKQYINIKHAKVSYPFSKDIREHEKFKKSPPYKNLSYMGKFHDIEIYSPAMCFNKTYVIIVEEIEGFCTNCEAESLYDEKAEEFYCPICSDKNALENILDKLPTGRFI
jgi:hypothetical protein